jgi:hypothetical protein
MWHVVRDIEIDVTIKTCLMKEGAMLLDNR